MQLTHKEIDEKRLYQLLRDLNSGKDINMNEMDKLCKQLALELCNKQAEDGHKIYGLKDV